MAKLFKTISLEERWKGSVHSEGPTLPHKVNQGSTNLKITKNSEPTSELLKANPASKRVSTLPAVVPFTTQPLSKLAVPYANIKFRSAINLKDRLKQPELGSTNHLAQYFLSDAYTDYIKITPFAAYNHTSNIVIQSPKATKNQGGVVVRPTNTQPSQGGTNPTIPTFNSEAAQGVIYSNGLFSSFVNINAPTFNSLLSQGVNASNGRYSSVINPTVSISPQSITQGPNITPTLAASSVESLQGIFLDESGKQTSLVNPIIPTIQAKISLVQPVKPIGIPKESLVNLALPVNITKDVPTSIKIKTPKLVRKQGETTPIPITFQPDRSSPILNVLEYAADRSIAFLTPIIKHGNVDVKGVYYNNNTKAASYPGVEYVKIGGELQANPNTDIARTLGASTSKEELGDYVANRIKNSPTAPSPVNGEGSISDYRVLSYDQIRSRANDISQQRPDFRKTLGITVKDSKSVSVRGVTQGDQNYDNDLVKLRVTSMRDGTTVNFRAFITSFSDSFNMSWTDINYVGRQDTIKAFKGVTRGGSVAFKIAALYESDMAINYGKLNRLTKMAAVGSAGLENKYVVAPLCKITVGKWFTDTPCVFNSIKYDVQMADYSWDIDKQMPHLVDVSLDFAFLGDVTGKPLDSANNDYFTYRG